MDDEEQLQEEYLTPDDGSVDGEGAPAPASTEEPAGVEPGTEALEGGPEEVEPGESPVPEAVDDVPPSAEESPVAGEPQVQEPAPVDPAPVDEAAAKPQTPASAVVDPAPVDEASAQPQTPASAVVDPAPVDLAAAKPQTPASAVVDPAPVDEASAQPQTPASAVVDPAPVDEAAAQPQTPASAVVDPAPVDEATARPVTPRPTPRPAERMRDRGRGVGLGGAGRSARDAKDETHSDDEECPVARPVDMEKMRRLAIPKERIEAVFSRSLEFVFALLLRDRYIRAVLQEMWPVLEHPRLELLKRILMENYGHSRREVDQLTEPPRRPYNLEKFAAQIRERMHSFKYLDLVTKNIAHQLFAYGKRKRNIKRTDEVVWLGNELSKYMWEDSVQTKCMVEADGVTRKENDRQVQLIRREFSEKIASWILNVASEADEFAEEEDRKRRQRRKQKQMRQQRQPPRRKRKTAEAEEVDREYSDKSPGETEREEIIEEREGLLEEEKSTETPNGLNMGEPDGLNMEEPDGLNVEEPVALNVEEPDALNMEEPEGLNDNDITASIEERNDTSDDKQEVQEIEHVYERESLYEQQIITAIEEQEILWEGEVAIQVLIAKLHGNSSNILDEDQPVNDDKELDSELSGEPVVKVPINVEKGLQEVFMEREPTYGMYDNPSPIETDMMVAQVVEPTFVEDEPKESPDDRVEPELIRDENIDEDKDAYEDEELAEETLDEREYEEPDETDATLTEEVDEIDAEEVAAKQWDLPLPELEVKILSQKVEFERTYLVKDQGNRYYVKEIDSSWNSAEVSIAFDNVAQILSSSFPITKAGSETEADYLAHAEINGEDEEVSSEEEEDDTWEVDYYEEKDEEEDTDEEQEEERRKGMMNMIASKLTDAVMKMDGHVDASTNAVISAVSERISQIFSKILREENKRERRHLRARTMRVLQLGEEWARWTLEAAGAALERHRAVGEGGDEDAAAWERWRRRAGRRAQAFLNRRQRLLEDIAPAMS